MQLHREPGLHFADSRDDGVCDDGGEDPLGVSGVIPADRFDSFTHQWCFVLSRRVEFEAYFAGHSCWSPSFGAHDSCCV